MLVKAIYGQMEQGQNKNANLTRLKNLSGSYTFVFKCWVDLDMKSNKIKATLNPKSIRFKVAPSWPQGYLEAVSRLLCGRTQGYKNGRDNQKEQIRDHIV